MQRTRWIGVMFEDDGDDILRNQAYGRIGQYSASSDKK